MKIIKPVIGGHPGCSFRELLDLWGERGYCEIVSGDSQPSSGFTDVIDSPEAKCWIGEKGNILIYDFPILDRLKNEYKTCLFGNTYKEGKQNKKWIFWPKRSRIIDERKVQLRKNDKKMGVTFMGAPTNIDRNRIANSFKPSCDVFMFDDKPLEHIKYLEILSSYKFGLCLPGVGPKCLRDIELMSMGVVPIFTPGVAVNEYYDPPQENIHFIYAKSSNELIAKKNSISDIQWKNMSEACIEWFEKNCSVEGSFKTTMEIINEN